MHAEGEGETESAGVYRRQGSASSGTSYYPSRLRDLSVGARYNGGENEKENHLADLYVRGVAGGRASLSGESASSSTSRLDRSSKPVSLDETDKAGLIGLKNIGNTVSLQANSTAFWSAICIAF